MYQKAYGIIETLAPLHVGATAGEETGNLNLIFRDSFTRTGIIPGSSIRGRLRSEIYLSKDDEEEGKKLAEDWYGRAAQRQEEAIDFESRIKIEHASVLWLPVFCSGQPIVWVTCPRLLARYKRIAGDTVKENGQTVEKSKKLKELTVPKAYTGSLHLKGKKMGRQGAGEEKKKNGEEKKQNKVLFFNLGFIKTKSIEDLSPWFPPLDKMFGYPNVKELPALVVEDKDMGMIHDMALYRQSRVALKPDQKVVADRAFFNVEALPEGTIMVFPIGLKKDSKGNPLDWWQPIDGGKEGDIFLGGLESVGFGHSYLTIKGIENTQQNPGSDALKPAAT